MPRPSREFCERVRAYAMKATLYGVETIVCVTCNGERVRHDFDRGSKTKCNVCDGSGRVQRPRDPQRPVGPSAPCVACNVMTRCDQLGPSVDGGKCFECIDKGETK